MVSMSISGSGTSIPSDGRSRLRFMEEDAPDKFSPTVGGVLDTGVGAADEPRLYTRNEVREGAEWRTGGSGRRDEGMGVPERDGVLEEAARPRGDRDIQPECDYFSVSGGTRCINRVRLSYSSGWREQRCEAQGGGRQG